MKTDVMMAMHDFHRTGVVNTNTNETLICLLPKNKQACKVSDYRPISLISSMYKILAKTLALRICEVLNDTIAREQSAFVSGRQILDLALIANEVVEEARTTATKAFVLKLDFAKAYDRVNWDFLDFVLHKKGFGIKWRQWMRGCISSVTYSILINGNPRGRIKAQRGLRQGDPLSPSLFILVADILGRMLDRAKESGVAKGIEVGRERIQISHLQFVDDSLLFATGQDDSLYRMVEVVQTFCVISGLQLNMDKCLLAGINMDEQIVRQKARSIGCGEGSWPMKYLGMPLGGSPLKKTFWDPVIQKIGHRIESWKGGWMSRGGRLTMLQAVLSAIPTYFLSLFEIPKGVAKKVEGMMKRFLWSTMGDGKPSYLVAWNTVTKPKELGGTGIEDLKRTNKAFAMKWLWRLQNEPEALWAKIIKSRFGTDCNQWDSRNAYRASTRSPWKFISSCMDEFRQGMKLEVGNGKHIKFWEDVWRGRTRFSSDYPNLYALTRKPHALISDLWKQAEGTGDEPGWDLQLRRRCTAEETDEVAQMMERLGRVSLSAGQPDSRKWTQTSDGKYSIHSGRIWLHGLLNAHPSQPSSRFGKPAVHPK
ncbi:hypothetical protein Scep_026787 [Stephania cephalantha]|uniref:Reverse transcriptase domain-containing protein n=1 Tax=Stephania cephalantha TaxID=152367 RepID=A0AAP0ET31_9MAGN